MQAAIAASTKETQMNKIAMVVLASLTTMLCVGSARAGGVSWSIGIDVPGVETVVSNGPFYRAVPRVYQPQPVIYAPAPVYVQAPVVVYRPAPVFYQPAPVTYYVPQAPVVVQVAPPVYRPVPMAAYPRYWGREVYWQERGHDHDRDHDSRHRGGWERHDDRRWDEGRRGRD